MADSKDKKHDDLDGQDLSQVSSGPDMVHDPNDNVRARAGRGTVSDDSRLEIEAGVPSQEAVGSRAVPDSDSLLLKQNEEFMADLEEELLLDEESGFNLSRLIKKTGLSSLLLILIGLGLLILLTQGLELMARLSDLPQWAQVPGFTAMGILVLVVLISLLRLFAVYLRLGKSPNLNISALKELSLRNELRQQADAKLEVGKKSLVKLLNEYDLDSPRQRRMFAALGFEADEIDLLAANRTRLLETAERDSTEGWLDQLDKQFIRILDTGARRRIRRYAFKVGVKTAAAPTGFVDTSIVLINAYQMIRELCRIYKLRAGTTGSIALLVRIFMNAFVASRMEEWMDSAAQQILGSAAESSDALMAAINSIARGIASRAAEGGANAFLLARLGAATVHYLRPLK